MIFAGATEGRGPDAVSGQEAVLWRIQVSQVQAQMDVGQQLGQYGPGVHQVSHKRVSSQAGERGGVFRQLRVLPVINLDIKLVEILPSAKSPVGLAKRLLEPFRSLEILRGRENEIS